MESFMSFWERIIKNNNKVNSVNRNKWKNWDRISEEIEFYSKIQGKFIHKVMNKVILVKDTVKGGIKNKFKEKIKKSMKI